MLGTRIALTVDYGKAGIPTPQKPCGFVGYELPVYGDIADILRPALIICPGGAYSWISDREGEPVAEVFLAHGISAYVLSYTCAPDGYFPTNCLQRYAMSEAMRRSIISIRIASMSAAFPRAGMQPLRQASIGTIRLQSRLDSMARCISRTG